MTELMKMAIEIIDMETENEIFSNCKGNRNWGIRIEHYMTADGAEIKKAYVGRYGALQRRGLLGAFIKDIGKYHIRWYEYTYKKDFETVITTLAENGFYIKWI